MKHIVCACPNYEIIVGLVKECSGLGLRYSGTDCLNEPSSHRFTLCTIDWNNWPGEIWPQIWDPRERTIMIAIKGVMKNLWRPDDTYIVVPYKAFIPTLRLLGYA